MRKRSWTEKELKVAVNTSTSIRQVIIKLSLVAAGGNYEQVQKYIRYYKIDTGHFKGRAWSRGLRGIGKPIIALSAILLQNSTFQSYKLKKRLFQAELKAQKCEICGWADRSADGRVPLELDHINGDKRDNRLNNLRILCPNCHSLQPTHRGKNVRKKRGRVLE